MLVNTRNKQTNPWKLAGIALLFVAVVVSLFSIFYVPEKSSEAIRSNVTPVSHEPTNESVLSESVDTAEADTNSAYEEALSAARSACEQAGYAAGSTAYDECTEREISQSGH